MLSMSPSVKRSYLFWRFYDFKRKKGPTDKISLLGTSWYGTCWYDPIQHPCRCYEIILVFVRSNESFDYA